MNTSQATNKSPSQKLAMPVLLSYFRYMPQETMIKRNCYCERIERATLKKQGIPEGYCGICEICSKPGHLQHFPGTVPYTGSWCDYCFNKVAFKQRLKIGFIMATVIGLAIYLGSK